MTANETEAHWRRDPTWQKLLAAASDPSQTLEGDVTVFTYQSAYDPYFTSSYYFETERGVVLVDTQMFRSAAVDLWEHVQQNTSGELYCVVNTHAHPDHYFGNTYFRRVAPQAQIVSSEAVERDMRATAPARVAKTHKEWGDEVPDDPAEIVYPDALFRGTLSLAFEGITLELSDYGPAEAPMQVCGWIPEHRALITADIVQNKQHLYFSDRTLGSWYRILQEFEQLDPAHVLTGHQGIAGREILNETNHWINTYLGLMAEELPPTEEPENIDALTPEARERVVAGLKERLPDWFDPYFYEGKTVLECCISGHRSELVGAALLTGASS
jgi:glyoxylase-like metal-dependent hydrolase (beta-lactamase superfamily II)